MGIDLGGSKVYAVIADSDYNVLSSAKNETVIVSNPAEIASQIKNTGMAAAQKMGISLDDIKCIGVAVPSSVDPETGDCIHSPNLGLKNYSLKNHLKDLFGRDVYLANDGNCGVIAEYYCGAAKGFKSVVGYFVGTGLGGGIIINGKLLLGNRGLAAELGHAIIKMNGRKCNCGNLGCVEAYASKAGFIKAIKKEIFEKHKRTELSKYVTIEKQNIKSKYLEAAYRDGDKVTVKVLDAGMEVLGAAAASVTAVVAPECIVLGGGVMEALGEELMPVFCRNFRKHLFGISPDQISLKLSKLMNSAVAVGAAILAAREGDV